VQNNFVSEFSNSSSLGEYTVLLNILLLAVTLFVWRAFMLYVFMHTDSIYVKHSILCHFVCLVYVAVFIAKNVPIL